MIFDYTYNTDSKWDGENTCEFLILHHTASGSNTLKGNINWLTTSGKASAHYLVGDGGKKVKIGEDKDILWHCGESQYIVGGKKYENLNYFSLGIEICGPDKDGSFDPKNKESAIEIARYLIKKHKIPKEKVVTHKMITWDEKKQRYRKNDVADSFWNTDFNTFEQFVDSLYINLDAMEKDYKDLYEKAIKETGVEPIFTNFNEDGQFKYLLGAGLARLEDRLNKKCNCNKQ